MFLMNVNLEETREGMLSPQHISSDGDQVGVGGI